MKPKRWELIDDARISEYPLTKLLFVRSRLQVYAELEAIVDKLATDSQRGSYTMKKITGETSNCEYLTINHLLLLQ